MTSQDQNRLSLTTWGPSGRERRLGRAFPGLLDGTVLLAIWMALWAVFVLGVVEPAARFAGAAGSAAQVERNRT